MNKSIENYYKDILKLESFEVIGQNNTIHMFKKNGYWCGYPRMLEYFAYDIDMKLSSDAEIAEKFVDNLIDSSEKFNFFLFGDSAFFKAIPEHFENNKFKVLQLDFVTNVLEIDFNKCNNFSSYLTTLKRKRRYKINKVLNDVNISLDTCQSDKDFYNFVEMHIEQWANKGDPSILNDDKWVSFYKSLYDENLVYLHKLTEKDGVIVAYHLGFELDNTFHYLMPTFIQTKNIDSPGFALLVKLIELYYDCDKTKKFSLGSGDYSYKRWLSNSSRTLLNIKVSRSWFRTYKNSSFRSLKKIASRLKKRVISMQKKAVKS